MSDYSKLFAAERVVSLPGAGIRVVELTLTPFGRSMLTADLPDGIVLPKDKRWKWREWLRHAFAA